MTFQEAAMILADESSKGGVVYKGHTFTRAEWKQSPYVGKRGGGGFGAKKYIKAVLEKKREF